MTYRVFFCCVCHADRRFVWWKPHGDDFAFACEQCRHELCCECTNAHHEKEATA